MKIPLKCTLVLLLLGYCRCEELPTHGGHSPIKEQHDLGGKHNVEFDHEAVIGSHAEHEEFEDLSPEEAKRRLSKIIAKMDTNNDDHISKQELIDWVYNSFKSLDAEEATEYFGDQDSDEDEKVTLDEYLHSTYGYTVQDTDDWDQDKTQEMQHFARMIKDDKEKFDLADLNKDGSLNAEEYQAFYHPWSQDYMHDLEIDRALEEHDENKDGVIDMAEYLGGEDVVDDAEGELIEKENFKAFDKDSDGKLTREEIKQWVIPDHMETAEDEADHLMGETDNDHDGVLSKEEILTQFELWVGSAATDYGLQLGNQYHDPEEL